MATLPQIILSDCGWYKTAEFLGKLDLSGKLAWLFVFAYGFLAMKNFTARFKREARGIAWHSMSRGESLFGSENRWRDIGITVGAIMFLNIFAPPIGFLFFVSRCAAGYLYKKQQASLYARYLDAMDAKIEGEYLEKALRDGDPATATMGIYGPLPKRFVGEHRANVARGAAGAPVRIMTKPNAGTNAPATEMAEAR
jgi:hypothetical protein